MRSTPLWPALLGLALSVLPATLHGQARPEAGAAVRNAAEVEAWFGELDKLHAQLEELQTKALADPQIAAAQEELGARVKLAMERIDPNLQRGLTRMDAMEAEAAGASARRDAAKMQQLAAEAEQIQKQFLAAQERALQQPEIAALVAAFQQRLEKKMLELNPESERIVARFRELESKLAAQAQGGNASR